MQPSMPRNAQMLGELVVPCAALDADLRFFTEELGMQLLMIFPAEAPHTAVVAGHGLRLRLTVGTPPSARVFLIRDTSRLGLDVKG